MSWLHCVVCYDQSSIYYDCSNSKIILDKSCRLQQGSCRNNSFLYLVKDFMGKISYHETPLKSSIRFTQLSNSYGRLDRKPPDTAGHITANTLIYLRPRFQIQFYSPSIKLFHHLCKQLQLFTDCTHFSCHPSLHSKILPFYLHYQICWISHMLEDSFFPHPVQTLQIQQNFAANS